ncbi:hypothetical protein MNB_SUP05-SYMBIONT-7-808 [hydrothermal vent metagenome]|uniref:Uncharacterized protein n=1 Tax=hydrothermal vent metagenome TaxID=652676 RepID=A0A1W1E2U1_9ZZZZ
MVENCLVGFKFWVVFKGGQPQGFAPTIILGGWLQNSHMVLKLSVKGWVRACLFQYNSVFYFF